MNTDNMSILGLTIDYGPYSFLDDYDPNFTPNTTDLPGRRYAFGRQHTIAYWNLGCLASAVAPLYQENTQPLQEVLDGYRDLFYDKFYVMMGNKLGLDEIHEGDKELIGEVEKVLTTLKPDMTIFFQLLMDLNEVESEQQVVEHFRESYYREPSSTDRELLFNTLKGYWERIQTNTCNREELLELMRKSNPRFILRNYLLHQAIEGLEKGDDQLFVKLQQAMKDPYSRNFDEFLAKRPDWASQKAGCSMLSCSS